MVTFFTDTFGQICISRWNINKTCLNFDEMRLGLHLLVAVFIFFISFTCIGVKEEMNCVQEKNVFFSVKGSTVGLF